MIVYFPLPTQWHWKLVQFGTEMQISLFFFGSWREWIRREISSVLLNKQNIEESNALWVAPGKCANV